MEKRGKFIISLDFELIWGIINEIPLQKYKENLKRVYEIIPLILKLFKKYGIHATWGVVGFLFFENRQELLKNIPHIRPNYKNESLSIYSYLNSYLKNIKIDKEINKLHFAPALIDLIKNTKNQEIASHTFSHYYALKEGQEINSFEADLKSALKTAKDHNIEINSIIFPKNQINEDYLKICKNLGITAYRGNVPNYFYNDSGSNFLTTIKKIVRFADSYLNIFGHNTYEIKKEKISELINIPASRFLYPYSTVRNGFEKLRLKRIMSDLVYAAKNNEIYHLWWHPHNFGQKMTQNIAFLTKILKYFQYLEKNYDMKSLNMKEISVLREKSRI